jgi:hypothetical protein
VTAATLKELVYRWSGRLLIFVAVLIFVAAVMGRVDWVGALMLWIILGIVAVTHGAVHDTGERGEDR